MKLAEAFFRQRVYIHGNGASVQKMKKAIWLRPEVVAQAEFLK
jgi:hypothetical protein